MKVFLALFLVFAGTSIAQTSDPSDGNQIQEPKLLDYQIGERTPGFSPITDIQE